MDLSRIHMTGPLTEHLDALWEDLASKGYTPLSARNLARVMAHLSRWMAAKRLAPSDLDEERIEAFLRHRRRAGYTCWRSLRGLTPILECLRGVGAVPVVEPAKSSLPPVLETYQKYLATECAVGESTIGHRVQTGQRFLDHIHADGIDEIHRATGNEVIDFLLGESQTIRAGSVGHTASDLRSFLRYLHVQGVIATDLATLVPTRASWRQTGLPKALSESEERRLLEICDRRTRTGRRDYAAIVLMLRLGLRVGEVGALELEDIDWRRGELLIHGKGGQTERLPLPHDVGQALSSYLKCQRRTSSRRVFLRVKAPHGPLSVGGLQNIVREAGKRAGIGPIGTHRLRHTAATVMLRRGVSLAHVSHVLRHRHLDTTAIYAKVDRESLRQLAQPWPGDEA